MAMINRVAGIMDRDRDSCTTEVNVELYDRVGRRVLAYLAARKAGRFPNAEEYILNFPDAERPIARRCFEAAAAMMEITEILNEDCWIDEAG